jgi:serine/threonine protein kinase
MFMQEQQEAQAQVATPPLPPQFSSLSSNPSIGWASKPTLDKARYKNDFDFLSLLGKGGFGHTFKVRQQVDSRIYALKAVPLGPSPSEEDRSRVLREVEHLSGYTHPNVVRYFNGWVEGADLGTVNLELEDDEASTDDSEMSSLRRQFASLEKGAAQSSSGFFSSTSSSRPLSSSSSASALPHNPLCNLCSSPYRDWEVSFAAWGLLDAVLQPLNLCVSCYKKSLDPATQDIEAINIQERTEAPPDFLFILMEHCDRTLLDEVKRVRKELGSEEWAPSFWRLFAQAAQGLAHLHASGVIHRDIKPANV